MKPWIKTDAQGQFDGMHICQNGKYVKVKFHPAIERVIRKYKNAPDNYETKMKALSELSQACNSIKK